MRLLLNCYAKPARVEDRVRARTAGYQLHVPKPIEAAELATAVASLVAGRSPAAD